MRSYCTRVRTGQTDLPRRVLHEARSNVCDRDFSQRSRHRDLQGRFRPDHDQSRLSGVCRSFPWARASPRALRTQALAVDGSVETNRSLRSVIAGWELPVGGTSVTQIRVDFAVTLLFTADRFSCSLRIENDFDLATGESVARFSTDKPADLGPVIALFGSEVSFGLAHSTGALTIEFVDGQRLLSSAGPSYEAWEFESSLGARVVSMPGGELAIWSESARSNF